MKKTIFAILFILHAFISNAQTLYFDELILLYQKKNFGGEDLLIKKGWLFSHNEKEYYYTKGRLEEGTLSLFAFNKIGKKADAWFKIGKTTITYEFFDVKTYNEIKNKIDEYKMKLEVSASFENKIVKTYFGKTYPVTLIMESRGENDLRPLYIIKIQTKANYEGEE